ncbi:MAG: HAD family phosphatase [Desulfomonile sp.]|jgi:putative hydrolase of the HAD superfamily
MLITDVIFDLGKVLVPFDWGIALRMLERQFPEGFGKNRQNDPQAFLSVIGDLVDLLEIGAINFRQFHGLVTSRTGLNISEHSFRKTWSEIFRLDANVVELGKKLAIHYNVWLASNTNEAHYTYIVEHFPEILFFRKAALSYELGSKKPETVFFTKAIELFGIRPEQAVFIDDLEENVTAAKGIGINAIQFTDFDSLLDELTQLGLFTRSISRRQSVE